MAFANTVLANPLDLPAGEVIIHSPYNVSAFDKFENGVPFGRFVKYDTGSIDQLDGSATPSIVGISKRKVTNEVETSVYSTSGTGIDSVIEVINFGFATVSVTATANPTKYAPVYVVNATGADAGKATQSASGNVAVPAAVFWEKKADGVWLVKIGSII